MLGFISQIVRPARKNNLPRKRQQPRRLALEILDARVMLSVSPIPTAKSAGKTQVGPKPMTQQQIDQQMGLPALDSLPGAPATIYLDFNGNHLDSWSTGGQTFTNVTTPVWDMDGNTNNFSAAEQAVIKEVWARVAEDYAPFNINVSTDYYGSFANGKGLQIAIGGDNMDWLKADASGISSIGSFHDAQPNIVFAFDMLAWARAGVDDGEGRPMNGTGALADTISHEAGHSFGLFHHSTYDHFGRLVDEYDPGSSNWTPIMGNNRADDRTTWADLPTDQSSFIWQDDMAVIAASNNGFGYRADDHGNSRANADALTHSGATQSILAPLVGKGIINQSNDADFFKFTAAGGKVQIEVDAAKFGPNLLPFVHLYSANGTIVGSTSATPTKSIISANLTAGATYYIKVASSGLYGDVGQYTVSVINVSLHTAQPVNATTTGSTAKQSSTLSTPKSTGSSSSSAGSGAGKSYTDVTMQSETGSLASVIAPESLSAHTSRTSRLRSEIVDAVHGFGLDLFEMTCLHNQRYVDRKLPTSTSILATKRILAIIYEPDSAEDARSHERKH
jgi:hypothetical protein